MTTKVSQRASVVLVAIGSEMRHDDGVGATVVAQACSHEAAQAPAVTVVPVFCPDPLGLLGAWDGADLAVVVDAVRSGSPPGKVVLRYIGGPGPGPGDAPAEGAPSSRSSSHGLGVTDVWELSRLIGVAPRRVVLVGVEGCDFSLGRGLSDEVSRAVPAAVAAVTAALSALAED